MSTSPVPPKFVPTLTQVVHLNEAEPVLLNTVQLETGLVRRVMARVDATLDQLLRDAVERVQSRRDCTADQACRRM